MAGRLGEGTWRTVVITGEYLGVDRDDSKGMVVGLGTLDILVTVVSFFISLGITNFGMFVIRSVLIGTMEVVSGVKMDCTEQSCKLAELWVEVEVKLGEFCGTLGVLSCGHWRLDGEEDKRVRWNCWVRPVEHLILIFFFGAGVASDRVGGDNFLLQLLDFSGIFIFIFGVVICDRLAFTFGGVG